jgi:hypothetical protein
LVLVLLWLAGAARLNADSITSTVKDPSGAVVGGACIEITGGALSQALVLTTDGRRKIQRTRFERREVFGPGKQRRI